MIPEEEENKYSKKAVKQFVFFTLEPQSRKISLKKELELKSKEKVRQFNELLTKVEPSIDLSKVTYDHSPSIKRP